MKKSTLFLLLSVIVLLTTTTGCSNDDNDSIFVEYTNPMKNNPASTVNWLRKEKAELKIKIEELYQSSKYNYPNGFIKLYNYKGKDYYEVGSIDTKPSHNSGTLNSTVYDLQGNSCVSYIGGDAIGTQPGYEDFGDFWETATLKTLLWEYKVKE